MISGHSSFSVRLVAGELYALQGNCGRKIKRWLTNSLDLRTPDSTIELYFTDNCAPDLFVPKYHALSDAHKAVIENFASEQGRVIQRHLNDCEDVIEYRGWSPKDQALIYLVPFQVESAPIPKLKDLLKAIQILSVSMQKYELNPDIVLSEFLEEMQRREEVEIQRNAKYALYAHNNFGYKNVL